MDRLESLLVDTLTERVNQAPTGPVSLPARSRTARALAVAACSSVVLVVAAVVAVSLHTVSHTRHLPHHSTSSIPVGAPAGMRLASYGPASLNVSAGLATRTSLCGGAVANEVVADDGVSRLCPVVTHALAAHPGTVVWLSRTGQGTPYNTIKTSPTTVAGQPARRGYLTNGPGLGEGVSGVVRLPTQGITVGGQVILNAGGQVPECWWPSELNAGGQRR